MRRHEWMVYKCRVCGAMFENFIPLRIHCRDNHRTERPKAADKKQYRIKMATTITKNPSTQTNQGDLLQRKTGDATEIKKRRQKSCNICSDSPGYARTLYLHDCSDNGEKSHTGRARIDELKCQLCGRRFRTIFSKNEHEAQHGKMVYRCPVCPYMFINFKELNWHHYGNHGSGLKKIVAESFKIPPQNSYLEACFGRNSVDMSDSRNYFSGEFSVDEERQCRGKDNHFTTGRLQSTEHIRVKQHECRERKRLITKSHDQTAHSCPFEGCGLLYMSFSDLLDHAKKNHRTPSVHGQERSFLLNKSNGPDQDSAGTDGNAQSRREGYCETQTVNRQFTVSTVVRKAVGRRTTWPKCKVCQRTFRSFADRTYHEQNHDVMKYKCPMCGFTFEKFTNLNQHSIVHHNSKIGVKNKHKCRINQGVSPTPQLQQSAETENVCNFNVISRAERKDRGERERRRNARPKCKLCDRHFINKRNRDDHQKQHEFMRYKCPYHGCDQLFLEFRNRSRHYSDTHKGNLRGQSENIAIFRKEKVNSGTNKLQRTSHEQMRELETTQNVHDKFESQAQNGSPDGRMRSTQKNSFDKSAITKLVSRNSVASDNNSVTSDVAEHCNDFEELDTVEEPEGAPCETSTAVDMSRINMVDQTIDIPPQAHPNHATVCNLQRSEQPTARFRQEAHTNANKETTMQDSFEGDEFLHNAHSSISSSDVAFSVNDDENDDAVFYQVVISRLGRLDAESRSLAALQIMKILHHAEFNSSANVPRFPVVFGKAEFATDRPRVEDVSLFKSLIHSVFKRLSAERRDRAKYKILLMFCDDKSCTSKLNPIPVDD